ncbi:ataxin-1 isoform X2 [Patella vulgata]|uniref:ataxin-1 isoform X2 n=1 Tax=Patella vulgata TaxID=6465 RepID=UPI00217FC81C|nr:ataxin-1 isoform X2 [Patella vulgata]
MRRICYVDSNGQNNDTSLNNHSHPVNKPSNHLQQLNNNNIWRKADANKNHNSNNIITVVAGQQHIGTNSIVQKQVYYSNSVSSADRVKDNPVLNGKPQLGKEDQVPSPKNELNSNKRMNSNGYGRVRMTGSSSSTNENLSWLADVAASQSSQSQLQSSESLLSSRQETQEGLGHSSLHTSGSSQGTIFRQSVTMAEGGQRLMAGSQYMGGNPSMAPYSPLYSVHGQPQHVSNVPQQYSALYQYPSSYSHTSSTLMPAGHYPHIESYSAVLASMGSHVQHGNPASQTQLPRTPFMSGSPMPQYSPIGAHRSLSAASSPGPLHPSSNYNIPGGESLLHETRSPKVEGREGEWGHRSSSSGNLREERNSVYTSGSSMSKSTPGLLPGEKDLFYKVPSGKEGSLKHRILTRPLDAPGEAEEYKYSHSSRHDEPSVKRTKMSSASGSSHAVHVSTAEESHITGQGPGPPQDILQELGELQGLPPPHLHYPPHFMRGSVIQLANNKLKRVEDLETSDFVQSAEISSDLKIDSSTVIRIDEHVNRGTAILGFSVGEHKVKVTVEATLEHPFFVFGQGWSSCCPARTSQRYGLDCQKLTINDVCISLTHKDVTLKAAEISQQQARMSPSTSRQGQSQDFPFSETQRSEGHSVTPQSRSSEMSQESYQQRSYSLENLEFNPNKRKDNQNMERKQ